MFFFSLFGCLLLHKEKKMRKFETTFASFEKATNQLTILNPFFTQRGTESNNAWTERGKDSVMLGSQQSAKHSNETYFFFPLYSFFTKRSSHFKLVVQHVKMKPAKRLIQSFCSLLVWRFGYIFTERKKKHWNCVLQSKRMWSEGRCKN